MHYCQRRKLTRGNRMKSAKGMLAIAKAIAIGSGIRSLNDQGKLCGYGLKIDELNNVIAEKDSYIAELESKLNTKEEELSAANAKLRESADDPAKKKIQFSKEQIDKNPALKYFA